MDQGLISGRVKSYASLSRMHPRPGGWGLPGCSLPKIQI